MRERPPLPSPWKGARRNVLLFLLTVLSMWAVGGWGLVGAGMSILMAHEMGHYLACRYYRVDASLPYFIPFPLHMVGTFGAFIRIREPFPNRKALFDIGIAGPFAGFVVCIPMLVLGLLQSRVVPDATLEPGGLSFGEPLLFKWATWAVLGPVPPGHTLLIGSVGLAAWFGLLVTAWNLFPAGQLDGGHVSYAILRRRSVYVSYAVIVLALGLVFYRPTWTLWTILLLVFGRRLHPPTLDDGSALGRGRVWLGILGAVVLVVSFTPEPFLISWSEYADALRSLFTSR